MAIYKQSDYEALRRRCVELSQEQTKQFETDPKSVREFFNKKEVAFITE